MTNLPDPNRYAEQDPPEVEIVPGTGEHYVRWREKGDLVVCRGAGNTDWGYYPSGRSCPPVVQRCCVDKVSAWRRRARWAQERP